jgi:hypothetical protein
MTSTGHVRTKTLDGFVVNQEWASETTRSDGSTATSAIFGRRSLDLTSDRHRLGYAVGGVGRAGNRGKYARSFVDGIGRNGSCW